MFVSWRSWLIKKCLYLIDETVTCHQIGFEELYMMVISFLKGMTWAYMQKAKNVAAPTAFLTQKISKKCVI